MSLLVRRLVQLFHVRMSSRPVFAIGDLIAPAGSSTPGFLDGGIIGPPTVLVGWLPTYGRRAGGILPYTPMLTHPRAAVKSYFYRRCPAAGSW